MLLALVTAVSVGLLSCGDGAIDLDLLFPDAGLEADAGATDDAGDATPDAGEPPDAGPPPACDPPPPSETLVDPRDVESACVFDGWQEQFPGTTAASQFARIRDALAERSLTSTFPLRTGRRVVYVAEIQGGEVPSVVGTFNDWDALDGRMERLAFSGFAFKEVVLDARLHRYRFTYAFGTLEESSVPDPGNRWCTPSGGGVDAFDSVVLPAGVAFPAGLVRTLPGFASTVLGGPRDVALWVPAALFDAPARRFPAVYALDGRQMLTLARADLSLEERIIDGHGPVLGIFADPPASSRRDEYTTGTGTSRGALTARFFAEELAPYIDTHFPTVAAASSRAITGGRLGGLQALHTAWNHAGVFGVAGAQSGAFFWPEPDGEALTNEIEGAAVRPVRVYLDHGFPNDAENANRRLAAVLAAKGYDHRHVEVAGTQQEYAEWGARWPAMLDWLLPPAP